MSAVDIFQELQKERARILDEAHMEMLRLNFDSDKKLKEVDRKAAKVVNEGESMPCLVRWTPGPDLTIYHSADAPCGRVRDRRNFRRMTEKAAKDASSYSWLHRCSACFWSAAVGIHVKRMFEWN
ncbi:hypothetical protein [Streptomyces sp. NPDC088794]|uniref:hypothetical protein n=1 Tax=Streptomyces sp. NPDC088794 TaxID=3365902 RepID=UPI003800F6C7